jgi:hypothetical protein
MCTSEYFILGKFNAVQKERTSGLISNMPVIYPFSVCLGTSIKISKIVTEANVQHNSPETVQ